MSSASGSPLNPSWYLAVDASTPRTALALGVIGDRGAPDHGAALHHQFTEVDGANQTSQWLVSRIQTLLATAGITPRDLAGIACGRGPGTFTGTRVAIATVQGLAFGLAIPVIPVSSLAAIASDGPTGGRILALMDARRGEVYAGLYARETPILRSLLEERCAALQEVLGAVAAIDGPPLPLQILGPGVSPYRDQLPADARETPGISAEGLWRATVSALAAGERHPPRELAATYLRRSYAELGIHRPKRPAIRSPFI